MQVYFGAPVGSGSGEQSGIFCRARFSDLPLLIGVVGATWVSLTLGVWVILHPFWRGVPWSLADEAPDVLASVLRFQALCKGPRLCLFHSWHLGWVGGTPQAPSLLPESLYPCPPSQSSQLPIFWACPELACGAGRGLASEACFLWVHYPAARCPTASDPSRSLFATFSFFAFGWEGICFRQPHSPRQACPGRRGHF